MNDVKRVTHYHSKAKNGMNKIVTQQSEISLNHFAKRCFDLVDPLIQGGMSAGERCETKQEELKTHKLCNLRKLHNNHILREFIIQNQTIDFPD